MFPLFTEGIRYSSKYVIRSRYDGRIRVLFVLISYRFFAAFRMTTKRYVVILSAAKDLYISLKNNVGPWSVTGIGQIPLDVKYG